MQANITKCILYHIKLYSYMSVLLLLLSLPETSMIIVNPIDAILPEIVYIENILRNIHNI